MYLPRTVGVSGTKLRDREGLLRVGIVGRGSSFRKFMGDIRHISEVDVTAFYFDTGQYELPQGFQDRSICGSYDERIELVDAVYVFFAPNGRLAYFRRALEKGKHVLCETPVSMEPEETLELYREVESRGLVLFELLKNAYSLAFQRMILLLKVGAIGAVKCVEATCTSLEVKAVWREDYNASGGSMIAWRPYVILPVLRILGRDYKSCSFLIYRTEQ